MKYSIYANQISENIEASLKPDIACALSAENKASLLEMIFDVRKFLLTAKPKLYPLSSYIKELSYDYDLDSDEASEMALENHSTSNEILYYTEDLMESLGDSEAEDFLYTQLAFFCEDLSDLGFAAECENLLDFVSDAFKTLISNICE